MVPILIYHSINEPRYEHVWGVLSLPVPVFEAQMAHIRRAGMTPITLDDVVRGIADPSTLPERPVAVTFDDGYLDNWLFATPILERYEIQATLFPPTSFVDRSGGVRPRAGVHPGDPASYAFMTYDELRAMESTGLVRVESHSATHAEIVSGPEILDFHHPGADPYWLYWQIYPERMPGWLTTDHRREIPLGTPVHRHGYAMVERRWTHPQEQVEACRAHVRAGGGERFFDRPGWREELHRVAREAAPPDWDDPARLESPRDYRDRVLRDLTESREELEREMGHPVRFLCWPCGLFDDTVRAWAHEAGYVATLDCECLPNAPGQDPSLLHRIYFGQDERYLRIRADRLLNLRFRGELDRAHGRPLGKLRTVAANRTMDAVDRVGAALGTNRSPTVITETGAVVASEGSR